MHGKRTRCAVTHPSDLGFRTSSTGDGALVSSAPPCQGGERAEPGLRSPFGTRPTLSTKHPGTSWQATSLSDLDFLTP